MLSHIMLYVDGRSKLANIDLISRKVDLHAELPTMSWREIAEICYIRSGRRFAHHSVKHIATSGPTPSLSVRRFQPWHLIPDPAECKLAGVRLHSEGWSIEDITPSGGSIPIERCFVRRRGLHPF